MWKQESLTTPELTATPLSEIPIALADESTQNKLITQIDKILSKLRKNTSADITAERKEIDSYIYKIYDLTEDEINIVEGYK